MYCAVLTCKNNEESLDKNSKISFHRFPRKNEYKIIWIQATGQDVNWRPNKFESLCSEHFKPSLFHIRNNKPFLNGWAVPTLKCIIPPRLNVTNSTPKSANQSKNDALFKTSEIEDIEQLNSEHNETDEEEMDVDVYVELEEHKQTTQITSFNQSNLSNDTLDDQLAEILFKINTQNRQIKHLLQRQRRYNARLPTLRDQIVNLNKSNETVCTNLENLGFPIASEILSRIILCDRNEVNDLENPYSEAFEKFIVTLYSLSPAAYNLMRTTFPLGVFPDENFFKNNCSILEIEFAES